MRCCSECLTQQDGVCGVELNMGDPGSVLSSGSVGFSTHEFM